MALRTDGKVLRDTRERSGIGQNELAAAAGISAAYLSQIENGLRQPRPQVARRLAKALDVPLAAITEHVTEPAGPGSDPITRPATGPAGWAAEGEPQPSRPSTQAAS